MLVLGIFKGHARIVQWVHFFNPSSTLPNKESSVAHFSLHNAVLLFKKEKCILLLMLQALALWPTNSLYKQTESICDHTVLTPVPRLALADLIC